jgi:acetolactate synthase I/II/III large subunit
MTMRGADAVIRTLVAAGTDTIFTLSGNHIMPLFDAAIGQPVSLVHTRHEGAAVHMADAHARMTGKTGVAMVTGGPGHANAVGALYTALAGETPMLLLSGHAPLAELGRGSFQELDQAAMAVPATKASWTAQSAATVADDIAKAIRIARAGRPGPVHVSLPTDVLDAIIDDAALPTDFAPTEKMLATADATRIVAMLRAAKRPLVIVPPALCTAPGRVTVATLGALGVPVVPMQSPRGVRDPMLGALGGLLKQADCVLLLGKKLDFTLGFGAVVGPDCRWIVVDPEPAMLRRVERLPGGAALMLQADTVAAITALVAAGPVAVDEAWRAAVAEARSRRMRSQSGQLDSVALCSAIDAFLLTLDNPVFVSDGGEIGQWAQAFVATQDRLVNGVAGAIGPAIPFAIGAKAAAPGRPVLAVTGDGTFGFHMAEFETAVRHGLPFVTVIGNDGRWNAEYQIQLRSYGAARTIGCEIGPAVRYEKVAEALGGYGALVKRVEDIEPALRDAFASGRPACVNVVIEGLPAPTFAT